MTKRRVVNDDAAQQFFDQTGDVDSYFRFNGGAEPVTVPVPASVMYRLFRLGQAYGIRQLGYLQPGVKVLIGSVELPEFADGLRWLRTLVNDQAVHYCIDQLLAELDARKGRGLASIAVSSGGR